MIVSREAIFYNAIYSCDKKAEFSASLLSFQCHMILQKSF